MSQAAHHHYPTRSLLPVQPKRQQASSQMDSPNNPGSPSSPLDFTDKIPFNELRLSSETLGSGSFGTVFKGRWRGRHVAVKQFKTREEIDSFLVEVKQLSCVKNPNIVTLYGASTLSDTAYLIMEYAEGGSLNHLLHECKRQDYDLRHACSWAMQTAKGVAYLHSIRPKPIMHRDLKPANLLLFSRGKILKICDFGTACTVKTKMTNNTGSALYMAPEVFATDSYLESGDVFSWGIIFWEILVRCQPYKQQYSNPYQILWGVNEGTRPLEIEGCPEPIWYLITSAWNKDPTKRPSMHQVAREVEFIFSLTEKRSRVEDSNMMGKTTKQACSSSSGREIVDRIFQATTGDGASAASLFPSSNQSNRYIRPSLPPISSPFERLSNTKMTTSDYLHEMGRGRNISTASTSSSSSSSSLRQYQNYPSSEQHYYQYRQQLSRQQEQSIQSQTLKAIRSRALQHHVELLQRRSKQLEYDLQCCKKNTASVSFEEFEGLKRRIRTLRQLMRDSDQQTCAKSRDSTPTCPRPPSPPEEGKDALQHLSRSSDKIDA